MTSTVLSPQVFFFPGAIADILPRTVHKRPAKFLQPLDVWPPPPTETADAQQEHVARVFKFLGTMANTNSPLSGRRVRPISHV
jgi:hypothetical protein